MTDIIAFCCSHSAYLAANKAIAEGLLGPDELEIIEVPCCGRLDVLHITKAFEKGADGVCVFTCHDDACQHLVGNLRAFKRAERVQELLKEIGIEPERLQVRKVSATNVSKFAHIYRETLNFIENLGKSPVRKR